MNVTIIGSGNIGSGLARTFGATNHVVTVASRHLQGAQALAETLAKDNIHIQAADIAPAVHQADVVILAVPYGAVTGLAAIADFAGKIVVDATNPITEDFSAMTVGFSSSAAEEIQHVLATAKVVKGFNTVFAQIYEQGLDFNGRQVPTYLAGNDEQAKATVMALAKDAGFDAINAGPLTNARYIEPLGYLNIQFGYMLGQGTQITPAWLSR